MRVSLCPLNSIRYLTFWRNVGTTGATSNCTHWNTVCQLYSVCINIYLFCLLLQSKALVSALPQQSLDLASASSPRFRQRRFPAPPMRSPCWWTPNVLRITNADAGKKWMSQNYVSICLINNMWMYIICVYIYMIHTCFVWHHTAAACKDACCAWIPSSHALDTSCVLLHCSKLHKYSCLVYVMYIISDEYGHSMYICTNVLGAARRQKSQKKKAVDLANQIVNPLIRYCWFGLRAGPKCIVNIMYIYISICMYVYFHIH